MSVTTMTWLIAMGGLMLICLLAGARVIALLRPLDRWTIESSHCALRRSEEVCARRSCWAAHDIEWQVCADMQPGDAGCEGADECTDADGTTGRRRARAKVVATAA